MNRNAACCRNHGSVERRHTLAVTGDRSGQLRFGIDEKTSHTVDPSDALIFLRTDRASCVCPPDTHTMRNRTQEEKKKRERESKRKGEERRNDTRRHRITMSRSNAFGAGYRILVHLKKKKTPPTIRALVSHHQHYSSLLLSCTVKEIRFSLPITELLDRASLPQQVCF